MPGPGGNFCQERRGGRAEELEGMAFWGSELPEIARLVPGGVFCLFTAAEFHGLTTYQAWQHHLAVERSVKITGLPAERVKMYYWTSSLLEFGIETIQTEGGPIRITTAERTVCDLVKYRNKTRVTFSDVLTAVCRGITASQTCFNEARGEKGRNETDC